MVVAGIVWAIAGANILRIGINCWGCIPHPFWLILAGTIAMFYTGLSTALVVTGIRFFLNSKINRGLPNRGSIIYLISEL